jgi:hypothetical protein
VLLHFINTTTLTYQTTLARWYGVLQRYTKHSLILLIIHNNDILFPIKLGLQQRQAFMLPRKIYKNYSSLVFLQIAHHKNFIKFGWVLQPTQKWQTLAWYWAWKYFVLWKVSNNRFKHFSTIYTANNHCEKIIVSIFYSYFSLYKK